MRKQADDKTGPQTINDFSPEFRPLLSPGKQHAIHMWRQSDVSKIDSTGPPLEGARIAFLVYRP